MTFDREQKSIIRQSVLAVLLCAAVLGATYFWLPPKLVGVHAPMARAERFAFALKWDLPMFIWLAGSVRAVSKKRFWSPADRHGSAYSEASSALAVRKANLQNTLEQTVLAIGATLVLAAVLHDEELVLLPLFVLLFLVGRVSFAVAYARSPIARAFGMAMTGAPIGFAYLLAAALIVIGR